MGPRTLEQLEDALKALEVTLNADDLKRIDTGNSAGHPCGAILRGESWRQPLPMVNRDAEAMGNDAEVFVAGRRGIRGGWSGLPHPSALEIPWAERGPRSDPSGPVFRSPRG